MKEVNYVFGALEEPDVEVLMRIGSQQQLYASDELITEKSHHDAIYLVLEGELSVSVKGRNTPIAYVGKGEIVGEMVHYCQVTEKQPTIAVLLPNSYYVLEFFFTAAVTNSILFPLNHRLSAAEIEAALRTSGAVILLTSDAFVETLTEIRWDTLSVQTIIWTSGSVDLPIEEHRSWDSLLSEATPPAREPSLPTPSSYLQGFGTSGTTGRSKTVLHSHQNVYVHSFATIQALELSADDDHCWGHFGPMFHVGDAAFVWIALLLGARHIFHENQLHFEEVGKLLADEHVTIVKLVPSMLKLMCESASIKALKFPDLRWILTGGAAPDPALVHRVATLFDCDLIQGFGMTEATCHVAFKVETPEPMKDGLRVLPGLDLKVVGPDDETVGPRQVGEIVIKGETVLSGYLADGKVETGNTEIFTRDGFYRSGDLGSLDAAGHVHIVGRRKDMINVGGENVFVGRPILWGLAVNGQGGVTRVLNLLNEELALTMKLAGCAQLSDITLDLLYGDPKFRTACFTSERPKAEQSDGGAEKTDPAR